MGCPCALTPNYTINNDVFENNPHMKSNFVYFVLVAPIIMIVVPISVQGNGLEGFEITHQ